MILIYQKRIVCFEIDSSIKTSSVVFHFFHKSKPFSMACAEHKHLHLAITLGLLALLGIITLILVAVTLGTINKHYDTLTEQIQTLDQRITDLNNIRSSTTTRPISMSPTTTTSNPMTPVFETTDTLISKTTTTTTTESLTISDQTH